MRLPRPIPSRSSAALLTLPPRATHSDLEQAVESLSELLERPLEEDKIAALRQQTTDKTVYVAKRCKVLLDDTLAGYEDERWVWQEPIKL